MHTIPRATPRVSRLFNLLPKQRLSRYHTRRAPERASPEVSELLARYAHEEPEPLTLSSLLSYAEPRTPESVLASVAYVQKEVPRRLAARIASLETLPYIVGTNPYIARTLQAYRNSFVWLATHPAVHTLAENEQYVQRLTELVDGHANDIPTMARGFQECTRYMSSAAISDFLDGAIRNRIDVRLLAEEHIAISRALHDPSGMGEHVGVVHTRCSPAAMIREVEKFVAELCEATLGAAPRVVIDGHADATFSYIPVHLQYLLTELLKNAFRATVEHHHAQHGHAPGAPLPPVTITLVPPPSIPGVESPFLSLRIRDEGGGVRAAHMDRVFSYAFTTAGAGGAGDGAEDDTAGGPYAAQHIGGSAAVDAPGSPGESSLFSTIAGKGLQTGLGTIAGLGYGLPMSRLYAKYFGGSLDLYSLEGWGTDCVVKLRTLDRAGDVII